MLPAITVAARRPYPPRVTAFTQPFWNRLAGGALTTTFCLSCKNFTFPPKPFCPHCWAREMVWRELSGKGVLYAATTIHAAPAVFQDDAPYRVGIVDLAENLRVAARLISDAPVPLDTVVQIVVLHYVDGPLFAIAPID